MFSVDLNCSNNDTENEAELYPTVGYPVLVLEFAKLLYVIVFVVGMLGNAFVIYVVLRYSHMKTATNWYIFNLAVADVIFLAGLPFLIITVYKYYWSFGRQMCKIYITTTSVNQFTTSLLLAAMSADRYVAVCHPVFSQKYRTTLIANGICLIVWTVSIILLRPIYRYANTLELPNTISCNIFWPESETMNGEKAFILYTLKSGICYPFVVILLFYLLAIVTQWIKNSSEVTKRVPKKVTYVILVYAICWWPYWIGQWYITIYNGEYIRLSPALRHSEAFLTYILLSGCLSYANSAVNPILYACLSKGFRKSFVKAFVCAAANEENIARDLQMQNIVDTQAFNDIMADERNAEYYRADNDSSMVEPFNPKIS